MEKKVKIAYLLRPAEGGIKTHLLTLLRGLDQNRIDPIVICPPSSTLADAVKQLGIDVIPLDIVGELNPMKDMQAALRLRKILREIKPDILHIHSAKAGLVGRLAVMSRRRPKVILTMHSFVFDERVGEKRRKLISSIERYFLKYTDKIVAVSQALKDELVSEMALPEEKIDVIYSGITFRDCHKEPHFGIRIGSVARLAPQKGVELFIRAAALVLAECPNVSFLVAGDGPYRANLRAMAESLAIPEAIDFLGFQDDIPAFLSTLDIFMLTSHRETFGLSVVEAMSQAVPVVATRVGGVPEIIDDEKNGLLAEPGNPQDIADKVIRLLKDPEFAKQMAEAGNTSVRSRFTAERMVGETVALYTSLMNQRRKVRA
ncbi:MAG TPA: glycosyltransferase family 4 protein [Armatimonadota bacterium]|nr:glycosyltransferase family 4 protein [Armatimonadota bacterium]